MSDPRRILVTEIALSMLEQWYSTWEEFKENRDGTIRRLALHSKARGLVCHDRCLIKSEAALHD